ncbi:N-acetyltransferase [Streptomyces sp. L2]|uniref:GNAT family N-acetyltransferase n=1 Tax=Streptomyces sp. L2 TaxID=2162665 RepID=UPI001012DD3E|nr:N-acetyltransferase [Streptomyces sp. L2]
MTDPFAPYVPRPASRPVPVTAALSEATPADVPRLAALQAQVRGGTAEQWADRLRRLVEGTDAVVVRADMDGETVGFGSAALLPPHPADGAPGGWYLTGVTVAPSWRRRRIGRALTRARMTRVFARAPEIWCFVSARNPASLDLHHALGFHELRRGPSFQGIPFDCGEGALLRAAREVRVP